MRRSEIERKIKLVQHMLCRESDADTVKTLCQLLEDLIMTKADDEDHPSDPQREAEDNHGVA